VALEPPVYCYHCEPCLEGRHNLCLNGGFHSSPDLDGFFCERVNLPARNLLALPANLDTAMAALWEPVSIAHHAFRFVLPQAGETAVVFGAGPIGLCAVALLKISGAARVWCSEPVAHRRELARRAGADATLDPRVDDVARIIASETQGRGVDMAIDCASRDDTLNQAIFCARVAGRVASIGIPAELRVPVELHVIRRKELQLITTRRANHNGAASVAVLATHQARFAPMLTHRVPFSGAQAAFEMLEHYADGVGKILLLPA
jgi:L-iditol 2-dehydrogenase